MLLEVLQGLVAGNREQASSSYGVGSCRRPAAVLHGMHVAAMGTAPRDGHPEHIRQASSLELQSESWRWVVMVQCCQLKWCTEHVMGAG